MIHSLNVASCGSSWQGFCKGCAKPTPQGERLRPQCRRLASALDRRQQLLEFVEREPTVAVRVRFAEAPRKREVVLLQLFTAERAVLVDVGPQHGVHRL